MNVIDYFGPKIAHTKLSKNDTQILFDICRSSSEEVNHDLVGFIREEVGITDKILNSNIYKTLLLYVNDYVQNIDSGKWTKVAKSDTISSLVELKKAWYNKQIAMEHNPPHNHHHSADLVCVIFPKIDLDNNVENYYINNTKEKQTGQLNFRYGFSEPNDFGKRLITVQPEEGDMFIFPSTLDHYTTPVLGNSVRYSISCNFLFTNLAHRMLKTFNKDEN